MVWENNMTTSTPSISNSDALAPTRWRSLGVILIASFMVLLDTSIVTNGLATIQRDLQATYAGVQFVLTAYSIAYGMTLIIGGYLGDLYGRKRIFIIGLAGFTLTSALCGLAWSPLTLIVFRVLQGFTAGVMFPQISSFIQVLFPVSERSRAFGLQGAVIGLGVVTGPLLGGVLIDANLVGTLWRPIFLINIPVGLIALVLAGRVLPESKSGRAKTLDVTGVLIVSIAMFLLTYPIIQGREEGWPAWIIALLIASVPVLIGFIAHQRGVVAGGGVPLVQIEMFADRAFAVGSLITFVFQAGVLSYFVAMSLFFQVGLGYSPAHAALTLIAYQIAIAVGSLLSAGLAQTLGRNILTLGLALLAFGLVATLLILRASSLNYQGYELIPALLISGFGFGCIVAPLQSVILSRINPVFAGSASGVLSTVQQVGSALGVALIGVIFFGQLSAGANAATAGVTPQLEARLETVGLPKSAVNAITTTFQTCFQDRSSQNDPNALPPSCTARPNQLPASWVKPIADAISNATTTARRNNFLEAILIALRFQLGIYALCFGLIFLLPGSVNQRRAS
jgi:EmrB/QacA subfamily drug resistance transporter